MSFDYNKSLPNVIQTHLDTLDPSTTNGQTEILQAVELLQKRVDANPATTLQTNVNSLVNVQDNISQAEKDLEVAKQRAASLYTAQPNYYESWFPINRPLRKPTIVILLGIGIFFFTLAFFMVIHALGFIFRVNITWYNDANIAKLKALMPYGAGFIVVALIILTLVGWLRNV